METTKDLQKPAIAICSIFFAVGIASMVLRCYVRYILHDFWWDDWLMLFGIVCSIAFASNVNEHY